MGETEINPEAEETIGTEIEEETEDLKTLLIQKKDKEIDDLKKELEMCKKLKIELDEV